MNTAITRGLAVVGAASLLVVGFDAVTYAATGSSLLLGKANSASTTTTISNTGKGAVLNLHTKTTATAPIVTNGKGLVANLNANYVGGNTAASLIAKAAPGSIVYTSSSDQVGNKTWSGLAIPAGSYLLTLNANVHLNNGGTPATPADPNEIACYVYNSTTGKDLAEGVWVDLGREPYASPTFSRVVSFASAVSLELVCYTDRAAGWTIPSDGFGPTLSFTKVGAVTAKPLS